MSSRQETLEAGHEAFRSTAWSVIRSAQAGPDAGRRAALDRLLRLYWRPVYWTLRRQWSEGPEDARDLTQDYFGMFLEEGLVEAVAPEHGSFRSFVRATLRNFMLRHRKAEGAIKRGGRCRIVALDDLERVEEGAPVDTVTPEALFDRELARAILREALGEVEAILTRAGRGDHYALFHAFYADEAAGRAPSYENLRRRFGLGPHEVKNRLAELRLLFRRSVVRLLQDGAAGEAELLADLRALFSP